MIVCKICECSECFKSDFVRGGSGTNIKNVEKISRGVPEKDKLQALVLYASGLSMN
ncbi:hypothetical protein K737_300469 [Holospora undulata HU1]|uniref:Uncharacterized protein n=1 Tax=Holospora undulata HU1 TaxID=1321371 RepID=A0A061JI22_9PROT|nr:hypothetical protein K737_300469 [Holospora undulata HU1]